VSRSVKRANHWLVTLLVACASIVLVSEAEADIVEGPGTNCPNGSEGSACHGGPHCRPRKCTQASGCGEGMSCEERQLCMGQLDCSGRMPNSSLVDTVEGVCSSGGACERGTCQTVRVCVSRGIFSSGRDCSVSDSPTTGRIVAWGSLGAALLICWAWRRRGR